MTREQVGADIVTPAAGGKIGGFEMPVQSIPGYDYGNTARSPVSLADFKRLEAIVGFTDEDRRALRKAGELFADKAETFVDGWRRIIGSHEDLSKWFAGPDGRPDDRYRAAVKRRFVQWVVDTLTRPFDQTWLDYQEEIGLRHTPTKKNKTDGAQAPPLVPLRYLLAFAVPILADMRERLVGESLPADEIDKLHAAWIRRRFLP